LKTNFSILKALGRKVLVLLILGSTAFASFAITGDGKGKKKKSSRSLLTQTAAAPAGSFSLKSGYSFRGSKVISERPSQFINLNTVATYQVGHTSYIVPLKKKVILNNRIVFNPNAATRN
jgi:hypothetical protein